MFSFCSLTSLLLINKHWFRLLASLSFIHLFYSIIHRKVDRLSEEDTGKEDSKAQGQRTTEGERGSRSSAFAAVWFWLWSNRAWGPNVAVLMKRALQPHSSPFSHSTPPTISPVPPSLPASILIRLYLLAFSTLPAPSLPVACQCDPCVVLQQRLAEAAERGNIYRSVRWGWALLLLHTHSSSSITATTAATHRDTAAHTYRQLSHYECKHAQTCTLSHVFTQYTLNNVQIHISAYGHSCR